MHRWINSEKCEKVPTGFDQHLKIFLHTSEHCGKVTCCDTAQLCAGLWTQQLERAIRSSMLFFCCYMLQICCCPACGQLGWGQGTRTAITVVTLTKVLSIWRVYPAGSGMSTKMLLLLPSSVSGAIVMNQWNVPSSLGSSSIKTRYLTVPHL